MSYEGRPPKRRKSAAQLFLGMIGLGREKEEEPVDAAAHDADYAAQPRKATTGPRTTRAARSRGEAAGDDAGAGGAASVAFRPPSQPRGSVQTLQEAARSALRALGEAGPDSGVSKGVENKKAKGKGKGRGRFKEGEAGEEDEEDEEEDKIAGVTDESEDSGRRNGRAAVKTEGAGGMAVSDDLDEWTELEALGSLSYNGKPLMTMLVAELRDTLTELGLSHAGRQPDLRVRLARRLCSDLAVGTPGAATMAGFGLLGLPRANVETSEAPSARDARHQRRRASLALKPLRKGPETKDSPIVISSSDDEEDTSAIAETTATAASSVSGMVGSSTVAASAENPSSDGAHGRRGKRTRAMRDATEPADKHKSAEDAKVDSPDAGPKPGMTMAELWNGVKALGLKPKGRRKADLEACWRDAVSGATKDQERGKEGDGAERAEGAKARSQEAVAETPEASVGGVRVVDMKVWMLKEHVEAMGLKPAGHLKADLQHCLCEALRGGHTGKGEHTSNRVGGIAASKKKSGSNVGDGGPAEPGRGSRRGGETPGAPRGRQPSMPSVSSVGRGRRARSERADTFADDELSPDRVWFHGKPVSKMTPEDRRKFLHDLDMASLRKDDDEVTHDLVDALVQRKAEAAEMNPRKQAWCGRPVYMMRKAELGDMLRDFNADDSGKVEEMRARFREELRKWAASEVDIPISGARGGGGASATAGDARLDMDEDAANTDETSATESTTVKGRTRTTRLNRAKGTVVPTPPRGRRAARTRVARRTPMMEEESAASTSTRGRGGSSHRGGGGEESTDARSTSSRRRRPAGRDEEVAVFPKREAAPKVTAIYKGNATKAGSTRSGRTRTPAGKATSARSSSHTKPRAAGDGGDGRGDSSSRGAGRARLGRPPRADKKAATAPVARGRGRGKANATTKKVTTRASSPPSHTSRLRVGTRRTAVASSLGDGEVERYSEGESPTPSGKVAAAAPTRRGHQRSDPLPSEVKQDTEESESGEGERPRRSANRPQAGVPPARDTLQEAQLGKGEAPPGSPGTTGNNGQSGTPNKEPSEDGAQGQGSGGDGDAGRGGDDDDAGNRGDEWRGAPRSGAGGDGSGGGGDDGSDSNSDTDDGDGDGRDGEPEERDDDEDVDTDAERAEETGMGEGDVVRPPASGVDAPMDNSLAMVSEKATEPLAADDSDQRGGNETLQAMQPEIDEGRQATGQAEIGPEAMEVDDGVPEPVLALRDAPDAADGGEDVMQFVNQDALAQDVVGEDGPEQILGKQNAIAGGTAGNIAHDVEDGDTVEEGDTEGDAGEGQEVALAGPASSEETDSLVSGGEGAGDDGMQEFTGERDGDGEEETVVEEREDGGDAMEACADHVRALFVWCGMVW